MLRELEKLYSNQRDIESVSVLQPSMRNSVNRLRRHSPGQERATTA